MTDAEDGVQEIGRALREQGRQVPERYAQLQASLDQARPVSVDGRGLSAAAEDQTSAEQGWAILTSGALHRHRQGRARAMLRGIFKDGKKGRKEAAEHEEARQKRLETVCDWWSLLAAGLLRNHRRTVGKVTLRNALRKAMPTKEQVGPEEEAQRRSGSGPPWRHSRSPRGKKEMEEPELAAVPKARSVSPRLQTGRNGADGSERTSMQGVQEDTSGRSRHKWKLRTTDPQSTSPIEAEIQEAVQDVLSGRVPLMVRSAGESDSRCSRMTPTSQAQLPERYAHLAPQGSRHDRTEADEDPDEGTAVGSADADSRITSRSTRGKERPDAGTSKARSASSRLETSRQGGESPSAGDGGSERSRPMKWKLQREPKQDAEASMADGAEAGDSAARDNLRGGTRSHSPRGASTRKTDSSRHEKRRDSSASTSQAQLPERYANLAPQGSRHDRTEADEDPDEGTAVGSADADSRITSRSTRGKERPDAGTSKARSASSRLETSRQGGESPSAGDGGSERSRPMKWKLQREPKQDAEASMADGAEAGDSAARDNLRGGTRSHSPRGASTRKTDASRHEKRRDSSASTSQAQLPERYAHLAPQGSRHDRTEADEDPDEGTAVGSADADSRITSRSTRGKERPDAGTSKARPIEVSAACSRMVWYPYLQHEGIWIEHIPHERKRVVRGTSSMSESDTQRADGDGEPSPATAQKAIAGAGASSQSPRAKSPKGAAEEDASGKKSSQPEPSRTSRGLVTLVITE
ncbi:unnamed protein product [Symbiodinium sp. CCMP2592]|nr:unnamed protein product [Symbiodinium sp. CCMP2592]